MHVTQTTGPLNGRPTLELERGFKTHEPGELRQAQVDCNEFLLVGTQFLNIPMPEPEPVRAPTNTR